jgi:hypothetical protein
MKENLGPRGEPPKGAVQNGAVMLPEELLNSDAYRALNGAAEMKMLAGFYRRRGWNKKGRGRGKPKRIGEADIVYTIEAMCWELDRANQTCMTARDDLHALGFIDWIYASDGMCGTPNIYRLSNRYLKWHPETAQHSGNGFEELPIPRKPKRNGAGRSDNLKRPSDPVRNIGRNKSQL